MSTYNKLTNFVDNHDIYLFGPMGVGKTTFVDRFRQETASVNYISMGAITRNALADNEPEITQVIRRGGKIPLHIVRTLISPHINTEISYVLDGVPRHIDEAEWIKEHIVKRHLGGVALTLSANSDTIMQRIQQRSSTGERTETAERIASRLDVYTTNQEAILKTLEPTLQDIIEIDTTYSSPHEVFEEFHRRIKNV
jgi:adenylate kinase family enzyme